jgi:hypothetical protein
MHPIETAIAHAVLELGISSNEFGRCDPAISEAVINATKRNFVRGRPAVWWFALKNVSMRRSFADGGFRHIYRYIPVSEIDCWFIPDIHEAYPLAYHAKISQLERVIGNCFGFPYYIVGRNYDWLLAESDSDELFFCVLDPNAGALH